MDLRFDLSPSRYSSPSSSSIHDGLSFSQAFSRAHMNKGAGETFDWRGRTYTTDRADGR